MQMDGRFKEISSLRSALQQSSKKINRWSCWERCTMLLFFHREHRQNRCEIRTSYYYWSNIENNPFGNNCNSWPVAHYLLYTFLFRCQTRFVGWAWQNMQYYMVWQPPLPWFFLYTIYWRLQIIYNCAMGLASRLNIVVFDARCNIYVFGLWTPPSRPCPCAKLSPASIYTEPAYNIAIAKLILCFGIFVSQDGKPARPY